MGFVAFNDIRACALNGNEWQRSLQLLNDKKYHPPKLGASGHPIYCPPKLGGRA